MKKFSILCLVVSLVFSSYYYPILHVFSNPNHEWEAKQSGIAYPIGTDDKDNYLLYSLGSNDWSKTRITKYSVDNQIILNKTVEISYAFFHAATKIIDKNGNFYLVDRGEEDLQIYKFDANISFIASYSFDSSITYDFFSCEFLITDSNFIYIIGIQEYEILNATHGKRTDVLFKMKLDGEIIWSLTFEEILLLLIDPLTRLSEGLNDLLYLTYVNKLHKINSENGKIIWTAEFESKIRGLVTFETDVCIVYKSLEKSHTLILKYINERKKEIWEKELTFLFGNVFLKKTESKNDKMSFNFLDTEDGLLTGKANEIFVIVNSQGLMLVNETWYSDVYFLHKRFFSLAYNNSYYIQTYNATEGTDGTTVISKFNFEAPPYTARSNFFIAAVYFGILILSYSVVSINKRKTNHLMIVQE